jgi:hypothetical protein
MKQNRAIIPSKRGRFKEDVREGIYSRSHRIRKILDRDDLSPEEKQRVLNRIRYKAAQSRRRDTIIYVLAGIIVIITLVAVYWLWW